VSSGDAGDGVRSSTGARRRWTVAAGAVAALALIAKAAVALQGGGDETAEPAASEAASGGAAEPADQDLAAEEAEAERVAAEEAAAEEAARLAAEAEEAERLEEERLAEEAAAEEAARLAEEAAAAEAAAEEAAREAEREAAAKQQELLDAQERLIELGYLVGAADGALGQQTSSALMAFQAVQGLSVDGVLGPQSLAALDGSPKEPTLRGGPSTRIEVDMDLQVLHLVEGDRRVTTMKASTGRGGTFESQDGQVLRAETPVGTFTIDRRIAGEKPSSYGIGSMWDPMYFHGPWAIHGSPTVPAGPASSGCVRIAMADGRWLFQRVPNGTPVVLYGGTHVFTP
jgi:lipoprotein-anchoring transpeptidase ErfK/SrfK